MNILIVGLGSIAQKHILAIKQLDINATLFALRSNKNSVEQEGIKNIYEIFNSKIIFDFAIISNPTHLHYQTIDLLIDNRINLFIEKPPVSSINNNEDIINKLSESKLINYVACNLRFHPCIQFLKNNISIFDKKINEVNVYCGSYLPDWRPNIDYKEVYSSKSEMGGGVHLDLFHEIDYVTWLFGFPKNSHSIFRSVSTLEINSVDYANYLFEYNSFSANIILNYYRKVPKRKIEIVFENEIWNIDLLNNTIKDHNYNDIFIDTTFTIQKSYFDQMSYYIKNLTTNAAPMNSFAESIKVLKLCLSNE